MYSKEVPGVKCPPPKGINFYIVIYKEMLKKCSSQELLHQMEQYLSIRRTMRFNFIHIKSLGSCMATS